MLWATISHLAKILENKDYCNINDNGKHKALTIMTQIGKIQSTNNYKKQNPNTQEVHKESNAVAQSLLMSSAQSTTCSTTSSHTHPDSHLYRDQTGQTGPSTVGRNTKFWSLKTVTWLSQCEQIQHGKLWNSHVSVLTVRRVRLNQNVLALLHEISNWCMHLTCAWMTKRRNNNSFIALKLVLNKIHIQPKRGQYVQF